MKPKSLIVGDRVKIKPYEGDEFEATFMERILVPGETVRVGKCRFLGLKSQTTYWLNDTEVHYQVNPV